jgi:hypothetical protein
MLKRKLQRRFPKPENVRITQHFSLFLVPHVISVKNVIYVVKIATQTGMIFLKIIIYL